MESVTNLAQSRFLTGSAPLRVTESASVELRPELVDKRSRAVTRSWIVLTVMMFPHLSSASSRSKRRSGTSQVIETTT